MPNDATYRCRVCGLRLMEPPWGVDGKSATFEICDCCGVEFGYEDSNPESTRAYRTEWLSKGANWFHPDRKPTNWSTAEQLKHVPAEFR
jgi:rubredoxin